MDIANLYEQAAAEVRPPAKAPCESRQCRAWYLPQMTMMKWRRCTNAAEQHDGTCWAHAEYYTHWWRRHVPMNDYEEDRLMYDNLEEMTFQIERGYVSVADPKFIKLLRANSKCSLFFLWLNEFPDFNARLFPAHLNCAVYKQTRHIIEHGWSYESAFNELHRFFDRGHIFRLYLAHVVYWITDNIQGIIGPATILDALLHKAKVGVTFRDIAGQRLQLAALLDQLRNPHIKDAEQDDRYNACKGRYWMWVSDLKMAEKAAYAPLKEELIAATWAPERLPFWCLDAEEVVEEHPEGLPTKEAWAALCASITV